MTEPKKCEICLSQDNPTKIYCFTCDKTFGTLDLPMEYSVLENLCTAYKKRCEMELK
jgi:hypothetical protein